MVWMAGPHGKLLELAEARVRHRDELYSCSTHNGRERAVPKGLGQDSGGGDKKERTLSALVSEPIVTSYQLLASVSSVFPLQEMRELSAMTGTFSTLTN